MNPYDQVAWIRKQFTTPPQSEQCSENRQLRKASKLLGSRSCLLFGGEGGLREHETDKNNRLTKINSEFQNVHCFIIVSSTDVRK